MVFVGRVMPAPSANKDAPVEERKPGSGVVLGVTADSKSGRESLAERLKALAENEQIPLQVVNAAVPRIAGYAKSATLPETFVELGVPELWPVTPAETVARGDAERLQRLLSVYLEAASSAIGAGEGGDRGGGRSVIRALTEAYGASGHEEAVREEVKKLLPKWAQEKATTDAAGNLVLHVGDGKRDEKTPRIAFVAHMDEIGYEVRKIEDDGRRAGTYNIFSGMLFWCTAPRKDPWAACWNCRAVGISRGLNGQAGRDRWMSRRTCTWERIPRRRRRSWESRRATT
jgi:putative aminopeptidase FrvX